MILAARIASGLGFVAATVLIWPHARDSAAANEVWADRIELRPPAAGGPAHPAGLARRGDELWVASVRGNAVQRFAGHQLSRRDEHAVGGLYHRDEVTLLQPKTLSHLVESLAKGRIIYCLPRQAVEMGARPVSGDLTNGGWNPNGILPRSPGLRGTSYPGNANSYNSPTPTGLRRPSHSTVDTTPLGLKRIFTDTFPKVGNSRTSPPHLKMFPPSAKPSFPSPPKARSEHPARRIGRVASCAIS